MHDVGVNQHSAPGIGQTAVVVGNIEKMEDELTSVFDIEAIVAWRKAWVRYRQRHPYSKQLMASTLVAIALRLGEIKRFPAAGWAVLGNYRREDTCSIRGVMHYLCNISHFILYIKSFFGRNIGRDILLAQWVCGQKSCRPTVITET